MASEPAAALPAASLLQLIWLASPALPVGGFSYSEGLEAAVDRAGVATESIASDWLADQLHLTLARGDLAVIAQAIPAWRNADLARIQQLNDWVLQTREIERTAPADRADGPLAARLAAQPRRRQRQPHRRLRPDAADLPGGVCAGCVAASSAGVRDCLLAYAFGWAENMVQAALKSVPLGQSAGQRILARLSRGDSGRGRIGLAAARRRAPGLFAHAGDSVGPARNPVFAAVSLLSEAPPL